ncbi:MAG: TIGR02147 family protein [Bdellovibrionales bacterium]|nr:TIGR02147 family protein [Bdellovibrionales bacterium]
MKGIYSYRDYRVFLRDFYVEQKSMRKGYTYNSFSKTAGIRSPNYLKLVIDGQRNLTTVNIQQFARALSLLGDELEYFESLVLYNQAQLSQEKRFYKRRMNLLKSSKSPNLVHSAPSELLKHWAYPAALLSLHRQQVAQGRDRLQKLLFVSADEADSLVKKFLDLGLLVQAKDGTLSVSSDQVVLNDPRALSRLQKYFLEGQLNCSLKAFRVGYSKGEAKFVSHCLTVPRDSLADVAAKIRSFLEDLTATFDRDLESTSDFDVVQINAQIFLPQTVIE